MLGTTILGRPPVYYLVFQIPAEVWFGLGLVSFWVPITSHKCKVSKEAYRDLLYIYATFTDRFTPLKNLKTNMSPKNQLLEKCIPY